MVSTETKGGDASLLWLSGNDLLLSYTISFKYVLSSSAYCRSHAKAAFRLEVWSSTGNRQKLEVGPCEIKLLKSFLQMLPSLPHLPLSCSKRGILSLCVTVTFDNLLEDLKNSLQEFQEANRLRLCDGKRIPWLRGNKATVLWCTFPAGRSFCLTFHSFNCPGFWAQSIIDLFHPSAMPGTGWQHRKAHATAFPFRLWELREKKKTAFYKPSVPLLGTQHAGTARLGNEVCSFVHVLRRS